MPFMSMGFQYARYENNLAATPSTAQWGTRITGTTTSASGKGAWTQLIASTGFYANVITVSVNGTSQGGTPSSNMTMDIGIGASGVENVLIPDLLIGCAEVFANAPVGRTVILPINIPAASRLSARTRTSIANDNADVAIWLNEAPSGLASPVFNRCDVYGLTTGGPSGTNITSGNSGAEGTWTNVGGTTTREYGGILMLAQGTNTSAMSALAYHFEVGIGGVTYLENFVATNTGEASGVNGYITPLCLNIPSSTQLQIRGECSGTAQVLDCALYCFY